MRLLKPSHRPIKWHRIRKRLRRHHAPLALASAALVAAVYALLPAGRSALFRLSMGTAYTALALLGATLAVGPLNVIRARPNPVSTDLRRDLGVWTALLGGTHVVLGLQVHFGGHVARYFFPKPPAALPLRLDVFGLTNYAGLVATLVLGLLALSNDFALRSLGVRPWKRLQRWNYGVFALVVLHGAAYQLLEERALPYVYTFAALTAAVLVVQGAGFRHRRRQIARKREDKRRRDDSGG